MESKAQENEIDIPADGDCLYTTVSVGYLITVINDIPEFKQRLIQLVGNINENNINKIRITLYKGMKDVDYLKSSLIKNLIQRFKNKIGLSENKWGGIKEVQLISNALGVSIQEMLLNTSGTEEKYVKGKLINPEGENNLVKTTIIEVLSCHANSKEISESSDDFQLRKAKENSIKLAENHQHYRLILSESVPNLLSNDGNSRSPLVLKLIEVKFADRPIKQQFGNPNEAFNQIDKTIKIIELFSDEYLNKYKEKSEEKKSTAVSIIELIQYLIENPSHLYDYYSNKTVAQQLIYLLIELIGNFINPLDAADELIFNTCFQLVVEFGYYFELQTFKKLIQTMTEKNIFNQEQSQFIYKIVRISNLMYELRIPRYELALSINKEKELYLLIYRFLMRQFNEYQEYLIRSGDKNIMFDDPNKMAENIQCVIGKLYLENLLEDESLWNLTDKPIIFFDIIYLNRDNETNIIKLLEFYKNSNKSLREAISCTLRKESLIDNVIQKFKTIEKVNNNFNDPYLSFSDIYFTQSNHTIWIDACQGVGYMQVTYDDQWHRLYSTNQGFLDKVTGHIFAVELLNRNYTELYFKIQKRDGWYIFKTPDELFRTCWDKIEHLSDFNYRESNPGFYACYKDKIIYLFDLSDTDKAIYEFNLGVTQVKYLTKLDNQHIFAIKSNNKWYSFNLANENMEELSDNIKEISVLKNSDYMIKMITKDGNFILFDLKYKKKHILEKFIKDVDFQDFSTVSIYCQTVEGHCYYELDSKKYKEVSKQQYQLASSACIARGQQYQNLRGIGVSILNSPRVRFDYEIELQGRYHITQDLHKAILWLHNTAGKPSSSSYMGAGITLVDDAEQISYLGCTSSVLDKQVFFSIKNKNQLSLYVSYYTRLKRLSDQKAVEKVPKEQEKRILLKNSHEIHYLDSKYFKVKQGKFWDIYELGFGFHKLTGMIDCEIISVFNYLKIKLIDIDSMDIDEAEAWSLYDLSKRVQLNIPPASDITVNANHTIVLIYPDYIRTLNFDSLPACNLLEFNHEQINQTNIDSPVGYQLIINQIKLLSSKGIPDIILKFFDHQTLSQMSTTLLNHLIELFDGYIIKQKDIQNIKNYSEKIVDQKENTQMGQSIERFKQILNEIKDSLDYSFSYNENSCDNLILAINNTKEFLSKNLPEDENNKKRFIRLIKYLEKFADEIKNIVETKENLLLNFNTLLENHKHILSNIVQYWENLDHESQKISYLFTCLKGLSELYERNEGFQDIISRDFMSLIKLYQFDINLINNYLHAEEDERSIEILFFLTDLLEFSSEELDFFKNQVIRNIPKSDLKCYEDIEENDQIHVYERLKEYIQIIRLLAVARQLNCNILTININEIKKSKKDTGIYFQKIIQNLSELLYGHFVKKLGLELVMNNNIFTLHYLPNLLYAAENFENEEKIFLNVLIKAANYNIILNDLFLNFDFEKYEGYFSNIEIALLKRLNKHNQLVKEEFSKFKLDWQPWLVGIESIESENITIRLWQRQAHHDLFQGEYCNSCIALIKQNAIANIQYLADFNFSMIEIIDNLTQDTIGHVTIWICVNTHNNQPMLVLNSIQVHQKKHKHSQEIIDNLLKFTKIFSQVLKIKQIILCSNVEFSRIDTEVFKEKFKNQSSMPEQIDDDLNDNLSVSNEEDLFSNLDDLRIKMLINCFFPEFYTDIFSCQWVNRDEVANHEPLVVDVIRLLTPEEVINDVLVLNQEIQINNVFHPLNQNEFTEEITNEEKEENPYSFFQGEIKFLKLTHEHYQDAYQVRFSFTPHSQLIKKDDEEESSSSLDI